jgi:hypothetical protein
MPSDLDVARYVHEVSELCGSSEPLQELLGHIESVFNVLSPDQLAGTLSLASEQTPCGAALLGEAFDEVANVASLSVLLGASGDLFLEASASGRIRYWVGSFELAHQERLVYTYRGPGQESFFYGGVEVEVPRLDGQPSRYAVPYFSSLEEALDRYAEQCARVSQCAILSRAWRDESRLVFAPKPEHHMRDSLTFWLRNTLRGHSGLEVMPEQNVNATRPVDIKVRWSVGRQISLIEVKWLGKSAATGARTWGSQHQASRAEEGLLQLATYLDLYRQESPQFDARGHLVVFDGRRDGLKVTGTPISRSEAFKHQNDPPNYDAELRKRLDMASPKRFFMEPGEPGLSA